MRHKHILLTVAFSAGLASMAWSADEPTQQTATPSATPAAQAPPAQPAAAASSTSSSTAKEPAKETAADADEKHLLARGYKKETHGNQTVYCRKEVKTGSHFETKVCGTAESMALQERQARDLMQSQSAAGSRTN